MANRTRAERAARKRRALSRVTETDGEQTPDSTETTDEHGVRGLLQDPSHIRSDLKLIELYGTDFTEDEQKIIRRRMGEIIMTGRDREAIAARKVQLMASKLLNETYGDGKPANDSPHGGKQVGDVHITVESGRTDVFTVAKSIGLSVSVEGTGETEGIIDGRTDDVSGTSKAGRPPAEERGQ